MISKIKQHKLVIKYKKYFRFLFFCFVGGTATLIHLIAFNFFRFSMDLGFVTSLILAVLFSVGYNFTMNRNLTFSAKGQPLKKQIPRYILVYTLSISAEFITAIIMKNILGEGFIQENTALFVSYAVAIPISFFGSLLWAFKKDSNKR